MSSCRYSDIDLEMSTRALDGRQGIERERIGQRHTLLKGDCISQWPCNRKERVRVPTASSLDRQRAVDTVLGEQINTTNVEEPTLLTVMLPGVNQRSTFLVGKLDHARIEQNPCRVTQLVCTQASVHCDDERTREGHTRRIQPLSSQINDIWRFEMRSNDRLKRGGIKRHHSLTIVANVYRQDNQFSDTLGSDTNVPS